MKNQMSETTKVGKRFTVVVPKSVRQRVKLEEGQSVWVRALGNQIIIEPLPKDPYSSLAKIIGEPYDEAKDEKRAEEFLKKVAGA